MYEYNLCIYMGIYVYIPACVYYKYISITPWPGLVRTPLAHRMDQGPCEIIGGFILIDCQIILYIGTMFDWWSWTTRSSSLRFVSLFRLPSIYLNHQWGIYIYIYDEIHRILLYYIQPYFPVSTLWIHQWHMLFKKIPSINILA